MPAGADTRPGSRPDVSASSRASSTDDIPRRHKPRHSRTHPFAPSRSTTDISAPSSEPSPSSRGARLAPARSIRSAVPASTAAPPGGHPLSLKVMRVSQPTLAATDWPYFEASEYASAEELAAKAPTARSQSEHLDALYPDMTEWERAELLSWRTNPALAGERDTLAQIRSAFELEARSSLLSNETHTAPAWKEGAASMSTLRDFPVSDLLMLPASFGTVYDGETFSAFVCVNNESPASVFGASLTIEMHSGPGAVSSAQQMSESAAPVRVVPLAHVTSQPSPGSAEGLGALEPLHKLEALVRCPISETGPHGLVCTVSYLNSRVAGTGSAYASLLRDEADTRSSTLVETYYRKFYRFQVAPAPVQIESRVLRQPSEETTTRFHPNPYVRERILLQVTLNNKAAPGAPPMAVESVEPGCSQSESAAPKWYWRQADRPEVRCAWWDDELLPTLEHPGENGAVSCSPRAHTASECLLLPGESRHYVFALYPTRPIRHAPLSTSAVQVDPNPNLKASSVSGGMTARNALAPLTVQPSMYNHPTQLGSVRVLCRSYMGERTLITSDPLVHHRSFPLPSKIADVSASSMDPRGGTPQPEPGNLARPALQLQTELSVSSAPTVAETGQPFELEYEVWVREVELAQAGVDPRHQTGTSLSGDESEEEEDRPLSEVASDVARSQTGSKAGSVASSRASSVHDTPRFGPKRELTASTLSKVIEAQAHQLESSPPALWLKLAVQLTQHVPDPTPLPAALSETPSTADAASIDSRHKIHPSVSAPLGYNTRPPVSDASNRALSHVSRASSVSVRTASNASTATTVTGSGLGLERTSSMASSFLPPAFQRGHLAKRRESSSTFSSRTATPSGADSPFSSPVQVGRTLAPTASNAREPSLPGMGPEQQQPRPAWPSPMVIEPDLGSGGPMPDRDVVLLGASVIALPPIRLAPGHAATSVPLSASYLGLTTGCARVGGARILLLDWWTETDDPNADPAVPPAGLPSRNGPTTLLDLACTTLAEVKLI